MDRWTHTYIEVERSRAAFTEACNQVLTLLMIGDWLMARRTSGPRSDKVPMIFARRPLGGSHVILIPTCKIETGKDVDGIEVSHSRKFLSALFVPCVAAPCVEINIHARQGLKHDHVSSHVTWKTYFPQEASVKTGETGHASPAWIMGKGIKPGRCRRRLTQGSEARMY